MMRAMSVMRAAVGVAGVALALLGGASCGGGAEAPAGPAAAPPPRTLRVLCAASLAPAVEEAGALLRAARPGLALEVEAGGSVLLARRVADLGHACDILLLADAEVADEALLPSGAAREYVAFAGGALCVAYREGTPFAARVAALPGREGPDLLALLELLASEGTRLARVAPEGAPIGYRTLLLFALAERRLGAPGLAARLRARTPDALLRSGLAHVEALVLAGSADACIDYVASAREKGLSVARLGPDLDLSDAARAAAYAEVEVEVPGAAPGAPPRRVRGAPILYAAAVPARAALPEDSRALVALLCAEAGRAVLERRGHLPLERPLVRGEDPGAPSPSAASPAAPPVEPAAPP
jgi:ABC-type molybdate transport system substrate-binding protein